MNKRVLQIRKHFNLNQEEFGEKLGITKSAVSNMEAGRYKITDTIAKLICSTFGVDEFWFRTGEGDIFLEGDELIAAQMAQLFGGDPLKKELISIMLGLEDDEWKVIKKIIINLAGRVKSGE